MLAAKASESTPPSFIDIVLAPDPSKVVPESNCKVASSTVRAFVVVPIVVEVKAFDASSLNPNTPLVSITTAVLSSALD